MKEFFVVEQKLFLAILSSMQPICSRRTTIDATTHILFTISHKELILKATDLEISLQSSSMVKETSITQPYTFLVSGKRIFDIVKELDGDITCNISASQLWLHAGNVNLHLNIKDAEGFPPFPERIENLMHCNSQHMLEMLARVAFLIPQNNANPALNGLLFEVGPQGSCMTTTDGHCLAQAVSHSLRLSENKKWLLPRRAIFEIKKILEICTDQNIFIGTCKNQLVFSSDQFNFFTKLLNDQFPHYTSILDKKDFLPAKVDRSSFVKTLRRSACLLSGQFIATQFNVDQNNMKVSIHNKDVGMLEEEIPLDVFEGTAINIRFYAPYLLSGMQVFSDDMVTFYIKNNNRPIIFESKTETIDLTYLVMPVAPHHE